MRLLPVPHTRVRVLADAGGRRQSESYGTRVRRADMSYRANLYTLMLIAITPTVALHCNL